MLHKLQSKLFIVMPILLSIALLTGCAGSDTSADTSTIGYVTESSISQTIDTSGSVEAYQVGTLTWGTSGTVEKVNVVVGDEVSEDDILLALDSTTVPSEVNLAVSELINAQKELEIAKTSKTALAEAQVALTTAQSAYNDARVEYLNRNSTIGSAEYLAILKNNLTKAEEKVKKLTKEYNKYTELPDTYSDKATALANLSQAKLDAKDALSLYTYYSNKPIAQQVAQIEADYALAESELEDAQRAYDLLKDGDNTDAIASAQAEVDAAQANVNKLSIIAPFDGEVAVIYSNPGDIVAEGDSAAIIVNRNKLYIDVTVDESSISSVKVGDTAAITFDSLNGLTTTGKVSLINPIGTSSYNVVNYTVRVELDESDPSILIGATASVVINVGEPENTLFVPVTAVLTDDQGEYVMRIKSDGTTERVTVVSGSIYDETVVVTGDLAAGDKVQLYETISTSSDSTEEDSASQTIQLGTGGGEMPAGGGGEMPAGGGGQMPSGGGGGAPMP